MRIVLLLYAIARMWLTPFCVRGCCSKGLEQVQGWYDPWQLQARKRDGG
jgi:hypothetical protein